MKNINNSIAIIISFNNIILVKKMENKIKILSNDFQRFYNSNI